MFERLVLRDGIFSDKNKYHHEMQKQTPMNFTMNNVHLNFWRNFTVSAEIIRNVKIKAEIFKKFKEVAVVKSGLRTVCGVRSFEKRDICAIIDSEFRIDLSIGFWLKNTIPIIRGTIFHPSTKVLHNV